MQLGFVSESEWTIALHDTSKNILYCGDGICLSGHSLGCPQILTEMAPNDDAFSESGASCLHPHPDIKREEGTSANHYSPWSRSQGGSSYLFCSIDCVMGLKRARFLLLLGLCCHLMDLFLIAMTAPIGPFVILFWLLDGVCWLILIKFCPPF